jgi:hypothetical protein
MVPTEKEAFKLVDFYRSCPRKFHKFFTTTITTMTQRVIRICLILSLFVGLSGCTIEGEQGGRKGHRVTRAYKA